MTAMLRMAGRALVTTGRALVKIAGWALRLTRKVLTTTGRALLRMTGWALKVAGRALRPTGRALVRMTSWALRAGGRALVLAATWALLIISGARRTAREKLRIMGKKLRVRGEKITMRVRALGVTKGGGGTTESPPKVVPESADSPLKGPSHVIASFDEESRAPSLKANSVAVAQDRE